MKNFEKLKLRQNIRKNQTKIYLRKDGDLQRIWRKT